MQTFAPALLQPGHAPGCAAELPHRPGLCFPPPPAPAALPVTGGVTGGVTVVGMCLARDAETGKRCQLPPHGPDVQHSAGRTRFVQAASPGQTFFPGSIDERAFVQREARIDAALGWLATRARGAARRHVMARSALAAAPLAATVWTTCVVCGKDFEQVRRPCRRKETCSETCARKRERARKAGL